MKKPLRKPTAGMANLEGLTPVWREGSYAIYQASETSPLPKGLRCLSAKSLRDAADRDPGDEHYGLKLRPAFTTGFAKYLVTELDEGLNELGPVGL